MTLCRCSTVFWQDVWISCYLLAMNWHICSFDGCVNIAADNEEFMDWTMAAMMMIMLVGLLMCKICVYEQQCNALFIHRHRHTYILQVAFVCVPISIGIVACLHWVRWRYANSDFPHLGRWWGLQRVKSSLPEKMATISKTFFTHFQDC